MSVGMGISGRLLRAASLVFIVAASVHFAACGAGEGGTGSSGNSNGSKSEKTEASSKPPEKTSNATEEKSVEENSKDKKTNASAPADKKKENAAGGAASSKGGGSGPAIEIQFGGDKGTRFSSRCFVGQERQKTKGKVPDVLSMETGGRKMECEILKKGQGSLETTLVAGESRYIQRTDSRWATISLTYSKAGFFSSVKTSSAGSGASSQTSVTSNQSSSVSSSSSSSSVTSD